MLAMRHYSLGNFRDAEALSQQVLAVQPAQADALFILGGIALKQGHYGQAEQWLLRALHKAPQGSASLWQALATAEHAQGKLKVAEKHYREALRLDEGLHEVHLNLGTLLQVDERLEAAEACYRRCLALQPNRAEAHVNLGVLLKQRHQLSAALLHMQEAVRWSPADGTAHRNLGLLLMDLGQFKEAEASFRQAIACHQDDPLAISNLLFSLNYRDDLTPEDKLREACRGGQLLADIARKREVPVFTDWCHEPDPQRLRVGLLSGDFCQHPVGYFLESTLAHVDSKEIELIAYDTSPKDDEISRRLKSGCSAWVNIKEMSDAQAARRLHEDGLHILIDLAGHTAHNRLPLLTCRPAPVQVAWLGYFATTGLPGLDYILVDPYVAPASDAHQFSERCVWMPETYRCFTPPTEVIDINPLPCSTGHVFTLGCFNNLSKLNPRVLKVWARILQGLPDARLLLKAPQLGSREDQEEFRQHLQSLGMDITRVDMEGSSDRSSYLHSYHRVDMALDPFPYTGGTVSIESLWMGVPILTLKGQDLLSRSGENLLMNMAMPEWIAIDEDDYVRKAISRASDPAALSSVRANLRARLLASPLCDAPRFAQHWTHTLRQLWEHHGACINT